MKKKVGYKILLPIIVAVALILPIFVVGKDYVTDYDNLFGRGSFTINTNELADGEYDISDLYNAVYGSIRYYSSSTLYEDGRAYNYFPSLNECDVENSTCDIVLYKSFHAGETEEVKRYEDVSIIINENVSEHFENLLSEDNDMVIQYDETMFVDEEAKQNYIRSYVSSKYHQNEDGNYVSFEYNSYDNKIYYTVYSANNDLNQRFVAISTVNDVIFDSTEVPYSDEFKTLTTDGNLTLKINGDITSGVLMQYLNTKSYNVSGGWVNFSVDGSVVNNRAYVKMNYQDSDGKTIREEKHLITLSKDTNIDRNIFALIGWDGVINIPADEPAPEEEFYYINDFMNGVRYSFINTEDGVSYSYYYINDYATPDKHYVKLEIYRDGRSEIQFNEISFDFVGYSNIYSSKFEEKFGDGLTVRSDEFTKDSVRGALGYEYSVLSCNDDVSVCDIALSHNEDKFMEIHKVNVTFDNSVSDLFKEMFNIKEDGTVDIISDVDIEDGSYFSYYGYDDDLEISTNYYRNGNRLELTLSPWDGEGYEKHNVSYNVVESGPTPYFMNHVYSTKDVYPGENTNIWNQLTWNGYFDKNMRDNHNVNTIGCDRNTKKCKVLVLNDDNNLEVHEVTANIKEGKSPEFNASFPNQKVKFNAIYKDDEAYLYGASMAYFMSKTKDYIYLRDFTDTSAKVVFNELEVHSFDVEYTKAEDKAIKKIEKAKEKLDGVDLTTVRKDLDFINKFYYDEEDNFLSSKNFNSKTLNDKFNNAVKDKHVGYYVVPEGGGGMPYMSGAAGRLVLFYDGVAYDILDEAVEFNNYNIVYIPTNTERTPEAYVAAAQARINEYLGAGSGVVVSYNGPVDEGMFDDTTFEMFDIDKTNFDNNEYKITLLDKEDVMLIVADSSKMQKPDFAATDVTENISVTSNDVNYPSNTVVMSDVVDKDDSEYSKILEKANVKNAHIVDINLYSSTIGDIKDFDGANFNVSVPLDDESLIGKELVAYYIDDEGNVEEHPVVMDDVMATFETTHFSTYIIAAKDDAKNLENAADDVVKNPNTGDNLLTNVLLLVISGIAIGAYAYRFIRREN